MFARKSYVDDVNTETLFQILDLNMAVDALWYALANVESVVYGKAEVAAPKKAPARKAAKPTEPISGVEKATPKRTTKKA